MRITLAVVICALPAAAAVLLAAALFDAPRHRFELAWTDELSYWHQARSFAAVGFANGYYAPNEVPAAASFTAYGPHGPLFPMLMGSIVAAVGWWPWLPVVVNLVLVTGALAGFLATARPAVGALALVAALTATAWPIHLYLLSGMQESLQQALAIAIAAAFVRVLAIPERRRSTARTAALALITVGALLRPTWGVLFLPALLVRREDRTRAAHARLVAAAAAIVATFLVYRWTAAPYPNLIAQMRRADSVTTAATLWADHLRTAVDGYRLRWSNALEAVLYAQLALVVAFLLFRALARHRTGRTELEPGGPDVWFHATNLLAPLLVVLLLYDADGWRGYRVMAPHLLLSGYVLAVRPSRMLAPLLALTGALAAIAVPDTFRRRHAAHFESTAAPSSLPIAHAPSAPNRWCNTTLIDVGAFPAAFALVPPGIGLSYIIEPPGLLAPPRSRYVLLSPRGRALLPRGTEVRPLAESGGLTLFRNLGGDCPPRPWPATIVAEPEGTAGHALRVEKP